MLLGGALLKVTRKSSATLEADIRGMPVGHFQQ